MRNEQHKIMEGGETLDFPAFKKAVKHRLIDMEKTQTWLCAEVTARCGRYCDSSMLKKVYEGKLPGSIIIPTIQEILDLPKE